MKSNHVGDKQHVDHVRSTGRGYQRLQSQLEEQHLWPKAAKHVPHHNIY